MGAAPEKIMLVSLGCDKNLVDSEMMLGCLSEAGFVLTDEAEEADAVVVNTCCFIQDAKEESIETLIEMGRLKSEGKLKLLIAAGCLAQRYADEIRKELPEVDAIVGTSAFDRIAEVRRDQDRTESEGSLCRRSQRRDGDGLPAALRFEAYTFHRRTLRLP